MPNPKIERALGGSPLSVFMKLLFLSLIVGAVMTLLNISPLGLFDAVARFVRSVLDLGTDAVYEVAKWIAAGALIVVPLWLLIRLFSRR
jgi:hypothetical protein